MMNNEEARQGVLLPMDIGTTNLGAVVKLNSVGEKPTGASLTYINNKQRILPHYLRASTSSCHDFCKYGREHTFRSKGKRPAHPRFTAISGIQEKEQSRLKILSLAERQKKTAKQKASAHQKAEPFDRRDICLEGAVSPVEVVECTETQIINHCSLFPEKKSSESSETSECNFLSPEKIVSLEGFESIKQDAPIERIGLCDNPQTVTKKSTLLEKTETSNFFETANKKKPTVKKIHSSTGPASVEQKMQSTKKVFASAMPAKPEVKQKTLPPVRTAISPGLPRVNKKEVSLGKRLDGTDGPALSGKSRTTTLKSISLKDPTTGTAGRKNESKGIKNVELLKPREKKSMKPPSTSLFPLNQVSNSAKSATPARHPRNVGKSQLDFEKTNEKTLYIIEPRPTQDRNFRSVELKASSFQLSLSSSSSSSSPCSSSSPSVSNYKEEENQDFESAFIESHSTSECGGEKANKAGQKSQRKMATSHPLDNDPNSCKLNFRRGKVVNPQYDNNGIRRLRFRQGRRLDDDQSGTRDLEKRSFRRKQLSGGHSNHPDRESKTVVLRHQDVQDKKDAPDLFNQIIEETASKLVQTRKSKVKALVGAFETVISLQETKPAASV